MVIEKGAAPYTNSGVTYAYQKSMIAYNRVKRVLDIAGAGLALILLSPVIIMITLLLKLTTGSVVFVHERVGKHGKLFPCYKFRTMKPNSDQVLQDYLNANPEAAHMWQHKHKLPQDPRVTVLGKWLRKTSLDELPQLWNVLKGDMSLVGPRPVTQAELDRYYHVYADCYMSVRPGITGLWQVSGRSDISYWDRVNLDVTYTQHVSWKLDSEILWRTPLAVLSTRGAA